MRSASVVGCLLLGFFVAPNWTPAWPENNDKADKSDKIEKKVGLSSIDEIEGKALNDWAERLTDPDPCIKEKAITIIPAYGAAAKHLVPEMIKRCKDHDLGPRSKAIMALGIMELEDRDISAVVNTLVDVLENDPQTAARLQAALSLARFDYSQAGLGAVRILAVRGLTDSGSWQIRKASLLALRRIGIDKKNGPVEIATRNILTMAAKDSARDVRVEALQALGFMGPSRNQLVNAEVHAKLKLLADNHDPIIGIWAQTSWMALDKVTDVGLKKIAFHLIPNNPGKLDVRGNAIMALAALGEKSKPCVPQIREMMLKDKDKGIVVVAAMALVMIGQKDVSVMAAFDEIIKNKETDERVRAVATQARNKLNETLKKTDAPVKDIPPVKEIVPKENKGP